MRYLAAPSHDDDRAARVGYAIGKKTGSAVERNRIRRRLRAAVSTATTPLTSGYYLISANPSTVQAPFSDLVDAVESVASQVTA